MGGGKTAPRLPSVLAIPPGKIPCVISGALREDTPEERVRQRVARTFIEEYRYPKADIEVEFPIRLGVSRKFIDVAIFLPDSGHIQENVMLVIEVKREKTKATDKKDGIGQLKSYMAGCTNAQFGCWTNGTDRVCFVKRAGEEADPFQEIIDVPAKGQLLETVGLPEFSQQVPAVELRSAFKRCHDYVFGNQGMAKDQAFHEFLKLIFCKVWDERNMNKVRFFVLDKESKSPEGRNKVQGRLNELFDEVREQYSFIFKDEKEKVELNNRVSSFVVSQLQRYSLLNTDADVKGAAYEEIVGANLRGDRGEFFTPRNVCTMAIRMAASYYHHAGRPLQKVKVIDPACGTGGFLVAYINILRQTLERQYIEKYGELRTGADQFAEKELPKVCSTNMYGIDFTRLLVRAAQMNELMHGDGSGNLMELNSLDAPAAWPTEAQEKVGLEKFDLVVTNPPFGTKIPVDDKEILRQYELGHRWKRDGEAWTMTSALQNRVPPEELFLERCLQLAKPQGIVVIVAPDRILSNPGLASIRYWILSKADPIASVSLPSETFQPSTGEQTDVLILRKRDKDDAPSTRMFSAVARTVGHDKRGTPIYKRSENGDLMTQSVVHQRIRLEAGKRVTEFVQLQEPILDDDLPGIADHFDDWIRGRLFIEKR